MTYEEKQAALWLVRGRNRITNQDVKNKIHTAIDNIGRDLTLPKQRTKLRNAIILNCENRKTYCFRFLGIDFISERDFYRRKEAMLLEVASEIFKSWNV